MKREIPDIDVIMDVLKHTQAAYPASNFISSLMNQYVERGSLSKKQLEGLHQKASSVNTLSPGKLATVQAIILKKHSKHRSTVSVVAPIEKADDGSAAMVNEILQKFPQHKRVLFFRLKQENRELLSPIEKAELEKFYKLLCKPKP